MTFAARRLGNPTVRDGIEDIEIEYKNPLEKQCDVQSPISRLFIDLFKKMDGLMYEADVLWFCNIIERDQKKDASLKSRNAITAVSTAIIQFNSRAQSKYKKMKTANHKTPSEEEVVETVAAKPDIVNDPDTTDSTEDTIPTPKTKTKPASETKKKPGRTVKTVKAA